MSPVAPFICFATIIGTYAAASPMAPCNVMDSQYAGGAKGDNKTEDTLAVVAALAACSGGSVVLPAGKIFLVRPIELPSHTTLLLYGDIRAWLDYKTWPSSSTMLIKMS